MSQDIQIRKAKPDYEEGLLYAKLFDGTSEGFLSLMLGNEAYEIIAEAYMKPNNPYSYENVTFAVDSDEICGMVSTYTYEMKQNFQKKVLNQSTKGKKSSFRKLYFVESTFLRALGVKKPEEYYLQAIIVTKESRGKGVGALLMNWIEEDARKKGARILGLDVSSKNNKAINLYEKQGFISDSRWPRFPLLPAVFTRMIKEI